MDAQTVVLWGGAIAGALNAIGHVFQLFPSNTLVYRLGVFLCQGRNGVTG